MAATTINEVHERLFEIVTGLGYRRSNDPFSFDVEPRQTHGYGDDGGGLVFIDTSEYTTPGSYIGRGWQEMHQISLRIARYVGAGSTRGNPKYQSKDMGSRADDIRFEMKAEVDKIKSILYREPYGHEGYGVGATDIDYDVTDGTVTSEVDWGPGAQDPERPGEYVEQPTCMMGILTFTVDFDHA